MRTIKVNLPPFSINSQTYRNKHLWTKEFKAWHEEAKRQVQTQVNGMNEEHNEWNLVYIIDYVAYSPQHVLFNQSGNLSSLAIDLTNWEKLFQDVIFKYCTGIDDKYVVRLSSEKLPSSEYRLEAHITSLTLDEYKLLCAAASN